MQLDIQQKKAEQRKARAREVALAVLMISPYFIIFILFQFIPFVMGIAFSFMKYDPFFPEQGEFVGLKNFINIFDFNNTISLAFWKSFSTMLAYGAVSIPVMIIFPLFLAYHLNRRPAGYKVFRFIIYLPQIISVTIAGVVFGNMFKGDGTGLINALFGTEIQWLSGNPWDGDFTRWVVIFIAGTWLGVGGNFIIFAGALRDVPKSLYEACEIDGGTQWTKVIAVTLPHIRHSINICLFNSVITALQLYSLPYVFSALDNKDIAVSPMMWIQKYLLGGMAYSSQTGYLCAAALVFGIIMIAVSAIERNVTKPSSKRTTHRAFYEELKEERSKIVAEEVSGGEHIYD